MNYVSIVNIVFFIISILVTIYLFHFLFFAIVGTFHKKRFPKTEEKCRYGVLVSAKDEENVISRLIKSIRSSNYPQDKLDIFIIAHNCEDNTAEVAKSLGANVIIFNDPNANTLGKAYHYAFKRINIKEYDGFIILNADNIVSNNYFEKLNDAFLYYKKDQTITSFRHSLNIEDGVMPALYSYYFGTSCILSFAGRENFHVSCRITGCGFLVPIRLLENGWNYTSITEDIEYSADKTLNGEIIHYCDEAIFYDEQPKSIKTMWFQRLRWGKGQNLASRKYFGKFLKALFKKNIKNKMSLYVGLTFHSFVPLLFFFLFVVQIIALLLSPLFGVSLQESFLYWNHEKNWLENLFLSFNTGALYITLRSFATFFLSSYLTATAVLVGANGKYKGQPKLPLIFGFILYPIFLLLQIPIDLSVLFIKDVKWKKIPHGQ